MLKPGAKTKLNGTTYMFGHKLGEGGNGEVWEGRNCGTGDLLAIKQFYYCDNDELWRMEALRDIRLSDRILGAAGVLEVIRPKGKREWGGCIMPLLVGVGLDEYLRKPDFDLYENILIAIQFVKSLADTHQLGIAHGDIHPRNIMIHKKDEGIETEIIDWDNAVVPGLPPPRSMGTRDFMAPESMEAFVNKKPYVPDIKTELCSGAKVVHLLLFGRASYVPSNDRDFEQGTIKGLWNSDPAVQGAIDPKTFGGITNLWATAEFADLFRRAFACDRDNRPVMLDWLAALLKISKEGFSVCQSCNGPILTAPRTHCPYCKNAFPTLAAVTSSGHSFVANGTPVLVGRDALPSPDISQRHAMITKLGSETFVTDLGSKNGSYRWANSKWVRLPSRHRCPIQAGDRIRFGKVELQIYGQ